MILKVVFAMVLIAITSVNSVATQGLCQLLISLNPLIARVIFRRRKQLFFCISCHEIFKKNGYSQKTFFLRKKIPTLFLKV